MYLLVPLPVLYFIVPCCLCSRVKLLKHVLFAYFNMFSHRKENVDKKVSVLAAVFTAIILNPLTSINMTQMRFVRSFLYPFKLLLQSQKPTVIQNNGQKLEAEVVLDIKYFSHNYFTIIKLCNEEKFRAHKCISYPKLNIQSLP